jgi:hypothetical protein
MAEDRGIRPVTQVFGSLSQRTCENLALILAAAILSCYGIASLPGKPHHFEMWVDQYLPLVQQGWSAFWREYSQLGQNDTNAAVRSPAWVLIIYVSKMIFANDLVAHRIPSALLTAFVPVIMAEIVRQFYRKDLALIVGLLTLASQQLLFLGRIGGYVGPTTTLTLLIIWSAMRIAWGDERKAWIPLIIGFVLMPMFYSTIRYMSLLAVAILGISFLRSSSFRRKHWFPCVLAICLFLGQMGVYVQSHYTKSISKTLIDYVGARGEQELLTAQTLENTPDSSASRIDRLLNAAGAKIAENLPKVLPMYMDGRRFFSVVYQTYEHTIHTWVAWTFFAGFALALVYSWNSPRYLFIVAWSLLGWVPLLFTTGLTNNRMLSSLPADIFLLALGPAFLGDVAVRLLGPKAKGIVQAILLASAVCFLVFSINCFFVDCSRFCEK